MPRIAYLDIIGGVSGDMLLAAMLDTGLDKAKIEQELTQIVPVPFKLNVSKTIRGAISSTHVDVVLEEGLDQRMGWLEFNKLIYEGDLPNSDLDKIRATFDCLIKAEGEAHHALAGTTHLHELGSLDTLIDIASAVVGMRLLEVQRLYASPLPVSTGMSLSSHGQNASIAPATMSIIKKAQLPMHITVANPLKGECITPTGAAILATLATFDSSNMTIDMIGYGAGTRNNDTPPNVVGLWLGNPLEDLPPLERTAASIGCKAQTDVILIEANLDDMTGEELGYALQMLFDIGVLDAWTSPIQMKKSRPGVILSAIAKESDLHLVASTFFAQTSTLGIRVRQLDRLVAKRKVINVVTEYGEVRVKLRMVEGVVTRSTPEYDDCVPLASEYGVPLRQVMDAAQKAASRYIDN